MKYDLIGIDRIRVKLAWDPLTTAISLQWLGTDQQLVPNDIITVKNDASKYDFELLRLLNNNSFMNVSQSKLAERNFIQMITQTHAELLC